MDYEEGILLFAPNLNWRNVELKDRLAAVFNVPIIIDNEANLATYGEYYFGSAYQHPDILYLSAGIGLGGGILHNAELLRGVNGMAGELVTSPCCRMASYVVAGTRVVGKHW